MSTLQASGNYDILLAAAEEVNLMDALNSSDVTVFAPNDAVLRAYLGATNEARAIDTLGRIPPALLTALLQYHVVGSRVTWGNVNRAARNVTAVSLKPAGSARDTLYLSKDSVNVLSVNGARVTTPDNLTSNGIFHAIDKVLVPPAGNLVQTAQADSRFTALVAAVQKTGLTNALGGSTFTVFAPTNAAFAQLPDPYKTAASIAAITDQNQIAFLTRVLQYHVVRGRVFSPTLGLLQANVATLLPNATVRIRTSDGVSVLGAGNDGTASAVVIPDIAATNGVVHVIDRVLLPPM